MSSTDELAVFVTVVEEGSFTAAARALGMPKSSISRHIARLEDRLGVRLLNRTTRSLSTTQSGAVFYERCVRIVAAIAEAEASLTDQKPAPRGPLSLAAPAVLQPWLAPLVLDFLAEHPTVALAQVGGAADVVISSGLPEDASRRVHPLPGTERILCAAPAYLEQRGTPQVPDDLQSHACLLLGSQPAGSWLLAGGVIEVSGPLSSPDSQTIHAAACAGLGIARLPGVLIAAAVERGALVPVLPACPRPDTTLYIRAERPSTAARVLVDFLRARL